LSLDARTDCLQSLRDQGTRRARAACRFSQTANAFGCGPRRHLPSALRRTGATRSGLAFQLPATARTKKLVRVSPAETSHYERRRRNAADHVSRSSLGARLVQADAEAGQGFRHLRCGSCPDPPTCCRACRATVKVECATRASPIQPVVAFYDYLYLGLSIPLCNRRVSIHLV